MLPSLGVEVGILVPSGVVADELAWIEVVRGVLVSTKGVERVLP